MRRINPYRHAGSILYNRLKWDVLPLSYRMRKRLKFTRDTHKGKKAIILCNGPSLNRVNFDLIGEVYSFGLNKINLNFDRTNHTPNSIVCVNPYILNQNNKFFSNTNLTLFLGHQAVSCGIKIRPNTILMHCTDIPSFAEDVSGSIFQGHSVTFVALQIAFYMGFKSVGLVGCDHNYPYKGSPNSVGSLTSEDRGHFATDYFNIGEDFQYPDLEASRYYYYLAKRYYESRSREIVNLTEGSKLSIFRKENIESFLNGI